MSRSSPTNKAVTSGFRDWLHELLEVRGSQPLWPILLGASLDGEFLRQIEIDHGYSSHVFIDRDNHPLEDGEREEKQVARLYRSANANDGYVVLEDERIWLLGYQWPTQGGSAEKSRRADLIGMKTDGSLVVFEAKVATGNAPQIALMEGLDYLACLLRPKNFDNILTGFDAWKKKPDKKIPTGFEQIVPQRSVRPTLVVLAPEAYFTGRHSRSIRSRDWPYLSAVGGTMMKSVRLDFATTDYKSTTFGHPPIPKK